MLEPDSECWGATAKSSQQRQTRPRPAFEFQSVGQGGKNVLVVVGLSSGVLQVFEQDPSVGVGLGFGVGLQPRAWPMKVVSLERVTHRSRTECCGAARMAMEKSVRIAQMLKIVARILLKDCKRKRSIVCRF